jgi:hypothetical protein
VIEPRGERVELRLPVFAVAVEPQRGLEDRPGIEPAPADPTGALLPDEAGADQDLNVARDCLQRDVERRGQFRDEQIRAVEPGQHGTPDRIGQCGKHAVERRRVGHRRRIVQLRGHRSHGADNNQRMC